MEDFNLSESQDDFIILPSQEESQVVEMTEAVANLPALKGTDLSGLHKMEKPIDPSTDRHSDRGSSPIEPEYHATSQTSAIKPHTCDSPTSSPTESSLQTKHGSSHGSGDQNISLKDHTKSSRRLLIPLSQEDMFGNTEQETGDDGHVLTPAEHIGSLQLSQHPMIVPETEDDTDNMIPASPEAYGHTPIIIPNSPTQGDEKQEDMETEDNTCIDPGYDVTIMNTFTDNPDHTKIPVEVGVDARQKNSNPSPMESGVEENVQSMEVSTKDFQAALEMPTLLDEEKLESLHLHLTESTQASHISTKRAIDVDLTSSPESLHDKNKELVTAVSVDAEKEVKDIIVIQSETLESPHHGIDDSQNLSLHLTPSQGIDLNKSEAPRSQLKKSQGPKSQGSKGETSQGSRTQVEKVRSRRRSKEDELVADVNAHPLVIWKDGSDTERKLLELKSSKPLSSEKFEDFHLSIPKDTPTEPPAVKIPSDYSPPDTAHEESTHDDWTDNQDELHKKDTDESRIEIDEEVSIRRALTITMIQSDSEACSQTVFRLDRPQMEGETEDVTNDTEDMFARKKISNPKVIQDDSEDPDGGVSSMLTNYDVSEDTLFARKLSPSALRTQILEENTVCFNPEEITETGGNGKSGRNANISNTAKTSNTARRLHKAGVIDGKQGEVEQDMSNDITNPVEEEPTVTSDVNKQSEGATSILKEMATQTPDKNPDSIEVVDSVVQKVSEYLQTGITPRSRTSSVCTDWSGSHVGEGSEKGDAAMKSPLPHRKEGMESKKFQRSISGQKSPEDVKHILQTYSNILSKTKRRKSGESRNGEDVLSRTNLISESSNKAKSLQPRRDSVQSLPAELSKAEDDVWITSRKSDPALYEVDDTGTGHFIPSGSQARPEEKRAKKSLTMEIEQCIASSGREHEHHPRVSNNTTSVSVSEAGSVTVVTSQRNLSITEHGVPLYDPNLSNVPGTTTEKVQPVSGDNHSLITDIKQTNNTSVGVSHSNKTGSISTTAGLDDQCHVTLSSQSSQRTENVSVKGRSQPTVRLTNISHLIESKVPIIIEKNQVPTTTSRKRLRLSRNKQKRLKSMSKRNALLKSSPKSQTSSGLFTNSTQVFQAKRPHSQDLYMFHGSQSQISPEHDVPSKTDCPTPKRRLLHRKSGLKKQRLSENTLIQHISLGSSSQQSDAAKITSSGSLPSIPSTISQRSPCLEPILSPSSSSSRQSVMEEITTRLSGKRRSVDQSLPDTILHSEEDNYKKVTIVTETVEKLYKEIKTTRKVVGEDGTVLECTEEVKKLEPVTVEENTHKRVQFIYIPSPSRSVTSLTSGDLADVSSSLSKSSVSSGSLGSKISITSSASLENVTEHNESVHANKSSSDNHIPIQKSGELHLVPTVSHKQPKPVKPAASMDNQSKPITTAVSSRKTKQTTPDVPDGKQSKPGAPDVSFRKQTKQITPDVSFRKQTKPNTPAIASTSAIISDQEDSDILTPLGSTINKTGSHLHERTSSLESPKVSDALLSGSDEKKKHATRAAKTQEGERDPGPIGERESEQGNNSSVIPHQVQSVSSSSVSDSGDNLISSSGTVGSRVIAKWKDGFYYPGTLKSSMDRYSKCQVRFDDGDRLSVKVQDILLIERLPTGQSVMVLSGDGYFECGLILQQAKDHYKVETDTGLSGSYSLSQVILSSDQASFLVSDRGNRIMMQVPGHTGGSAAPANVGDVSLDNLVDTPRRKVDRGVDNLVDTPGRKADRGPEKVKDKDNPPEVGQSSRGRKRKMDVLKPQATSTPTPKGKSAVIKRRKVERTYETSPIAMPSEVPDKRSPKKTKVGLFRKDKGPLPVKKLFKGLNVLLTNVDKSSEQLNHEKKLLKPTSLDTSTDDSSQEDEACAPFDKDHLVAQIQAGGGTVIDNFDAKLLSGKKRCVLISSTYQRTIKFLQCLACGIPCVSHMWIVDSSTQNQLLDQKSYILPAGISLEKRKLMEWKAKDDVFIGLKAVVHSKDSKFVETWSNILQLSQCQVHKQLQYTDTAVIVSDRTCLSGVERQANNKNVPIVSTEWVIQCLINGKTVGFTGHPRYRHDFLT